MTIKDTEEDHEMKLRLIAEGAWPGHEIAHEQSAKNLAYTALRKLRLMLAPLALLKGPNGQPTTNLVKHSVAEPLPAIVGPFSQLRRVVERLAAQDAQRVENGQGRQEAGLFWGIQLPTGLYDQEATQFGRANESGTFDKILNGFVQKYSAASLEEKINAFGQLADEIVRAHG